MTSPRQGQTLVIVLWVLGLVTMALGAVNVRASHELRLGRIPLDALQREAIAQAGVHYAIQIIQQDTQEAPTVDTLDEPWASGRHADGTAFFAQLPIGAGLCSIGRLEEGAWVPGVIDEERKMPLNAATVVQLQRLVDAVQPGGIDAQAVAEAIVDWRDELVGAPCADAAPPPCHQAPFALLDELRLVPNMTPELFAALAPHVTVYGSGLVNVNTASAIVLNAMGYPGEEIVEQRATEPYTSYAGLTVLSTAFTIPVEAMLSNNAMTVRLHAVVDRAGCSATPPEGTRCILAWSPQQI